MMCDWMKRENRLVAFSMSAPSDLEVRLIRIRTLDFMISILQDSSFPSSKVCGKGDKILLMYNLFWLLHFVLVIWN
jgi:hypothetical protein